MSRSISVDRRELNGSGQIGYTLTAVISGMGESGEKAEIVSSDKETLDITTSRISAEDWKELSQNIQTTARSVVTVALPEKGLQSKTKEKSKPAIMKRIEQALDKKSPSLAINSQITFPKIAAVGSNIILSLHLGSVSSPNATNNDFSLPPITLQRVEVNLKDVITLRCSRSVLRFDDHVNDFPGSHVGEMSCHLNHIFNPTEDRKGYQDSECRVKFKIPASCPPTFKTWNISNQ
ncbi:hypothetical protein PISL3812_01231 [Talaromyces islandicus]|uniref:Uncharacterized protein n=1 Tax=Talaromyces islandicus TaxID=28573 RepID=A0A0U1LLN6_TALIS|nr:hypothetical protein PISL3812_01231 [Talaromyces islandicus]